MASAIQSWQIKLIRRKNNSRHSKGWKRKVVESISTTLCTTHSHLLSLSKYYAASSTGASHLLALQRKIGRRKEGKKERRNGRKFDRILICFKSVNKQIFTRLLCLTCISNKSLHCSVKCDASLLFRTCRKTAQRQEQDTDQCSGDLHGGCCQCWLVHLHKAARPCFWSLPPR